jgi:hypothetical protein
MESMVTSNASGLRPKLGPSRGWYVLALAVFIATLTGAGPLLRILFVELDDDQFVRVSAPGRAELNLSQVGTYTIFQEGGSPSFVDGSLDVSVNSAGLRVTVRSRAGDSVPVYATPGKLRYSNSSKGRSGASVFDFTVQRPGIYDLVATYDDGGEQRKAVIAIAHEFGKNLWTTLGLIFGAVGGMGIAVAIAIGVFLKRRNATQLATKS